MKSPQSSNKGKDESGHDGQFCNQPYIVGPLPHLSSAHYELGAGIPVIPLPFVKENASGTSNSTIQRSIVSSKVQPTVTQKSRSGVFSPTTEANILRIHAAPSTIEDSTTSFSTENDIAARRLSPLPIPSLSSEEKILQERRLNLWRKEDKEESESQGFFKNDSNQNALAHQSSEASGNSTNQDKMTDNDQSKKWVEYWDEEVGASYYYNIITGEASWVGPDSS